MGKPQQQVLKYILSCNSFLKLNENQIIHFCDPCQQGKKLEMKF